MNWHALDKYNLTPLLLRVGLAAVFIYAATGSLLNPNDWVGFLPSFLTDHISATLMLKGLALSQLALAAWLLSGVYVRYAALLAAAMLGGILLFNLSTLIVTFRDIGLFFAALALAFHRDTKK